MTTTLLFIGILMGCSVSADDENIESEDNNTKLSDSSSVIETSFYSLEGTGLSWIGIPKDKITIINNSESLKEYLDGEGKYPDINFSSQTLFLISGYSTHGIDDISKELIHSYTGQYIIYIIISTNDATIMQEWNIAIITHKLTEQGQFELKVITEP